MEDKEKPHNFLSIFRIHSCLFSCESKYFRTLMMLYSISHALIFNCTPPIVQLLKHGQLHMLKYLSSLILRTSLFASVMTQALEESLKFYLILSTLCNISIKKLYCPFKKVSLKLLHVGFSFQLYHINMKY